MTGRPYPGVTEQLQFDRESGLLLRRSITTATPLGPLPEQIDYSDYRDVNGVKVPFRPLRDLERGHDGEADRRQVQRAGHRRGVREAGCGAR